MESTIDQELNRFITQLSEPEKKSVLLMLKTFLQERQQSAQRISLEEYNREIDEAIAAFEAGNFISQEEMEKRAAKW
jgi:hypothetical protein